MMRDVIDDLRTTPSELRKRLQSVGFANVEALVHQRGNLVAFPMGKIGWKDVEGFADICGCPISPLGF